MKIRFLPLAVVLAFLTSAVTSCGGSDDGPSRPVISDTGTPPPSTPGSPLSGLPATFTGVLPCADCPGIQYTLNLMPDRTFFLRRVYQGRPGESRSDDIGRWVVGSDGRTLTLKGTGARPIYFAMPDRSTLRKLDENAQPLSSSASQDLRRRETFETLALSTVMRGGFALDDDDGGVFTECSTRRRWPVDGSALDALENAYHAQRLEQGEALLVRVEGDLSERPRARGGSDTVLTVSRLVETFPGEACGESYGTSLLEGTSWRLTEVRGQPVEPVAGRAPAVLTLESATAQFASSGGCNRQLGSFRRNGERLSFTPAVTTRDVCPPGMQAEQAFVGILANVAGWRILGQTLELSDAGGVVLARFEAQQ